MRYRSAKSSSDGSSVTALHDQVPSKLAAEVWNCISKYKTTIPDYPQKETCELLIVDRLIDQVQLTFPLAGYQILSFGESSLI